MPELLRIKGELLLLDNASGSAAAAEESFREGLEIARQQGALFWELRGATSLARLRISQDRKRNAASVLRPVYDRFTEGSQIADLRAARILLQSLPQ